MPVGLLCQATTRSAAVEIAVPRALQPISRVVGRSSRGSGVGPLNAKGREVEVVDQGVAETDGIRCSHVGVAPRWKQERFVALRAVDQAHNGTTLQESKDVSRGREP